MVAFVAVSLFETLGVFWNSQKSETYKAFFEKHLQLHDFSIRGALQNLVCIQWFTSKCFAKKFVVSFVSVLAMLFIYCENGLV